MKLLIILLLLYFNINFKHKLEIQFSCSIKAFINAALYHYWLLASAMVAGMPYCWDQKVIFQLFFPVSHVHNFDCTIISFAQCSGGHIYHIVELQRLANGSSIGIFISCLPCFFAILVIYGSEKLRTYSRFGSCTGGYKQSTS